MFPQKSAFQRTKEEFGCIDIVCNNAGITNEDNWRLTLDINLVCGTIKVTLCIVECTYVMQHAVIEGTYLALEYMSTNNGGKGGTVINVSSMAGQSSMATLHSCLIIPRPNFQLFYVDLF